MEVNVDTNQKGQIAELKVQLRATELGWICSHTIAGARYDLVLDDGKKLYRVQVKYAGGKTSHCEGSASVCLRSNEGDVRNMKYSRTKTKKYSGLEVDAVLAYLPQIDKIVWLNPELFEGKAVISVRYQAPKNGQLKGVNLVDDLVW